MRRVLAILVCSTFFTTSALAQPVIFPDGSSSDQPGGLIIMRRGGQTTWSLGGVLFPRAVKVVNKTPEVKEITRFKMPSVFRDPYAPLLSDMIPAAVHVQVPDPHALLFIDGEKVRTTGTSRQLESPALAQGKDHPVHIRAAYKIGNNFLIEDHVIHLRGGESTAVTFDGRGALVVQLTKEQTGTARRTP